MGYYHIRLDPDSSKICTIILPWGTYSYQRLQMGIIGSLDIFQEEISSLMTSLEFIRMYIDIDDLLGVSTGTLDDELEKLCQVLVRLCDTNLKVDATKSLFFSTECNYLW